MSHVATLPLDAALSEPASSDEALPLSGVAVGESAIVVKLLLEEDVAGWLRAVGISEGERVTVLRWAVFGGPIHLRTSSGGEFALHRSLAASVMIRKIARTALGEHDGESQP